MTNKEALDELKKVRTINVSRKENKYMFDSFVKISNESLDKAIEALENQKTGHWIEMNTNPDGTHNMYCSNCNIYQKFKGHTNSYNARTKLKYCPNCGAKMEGE